MTPAREAARRLLHLRPLAGRRPPRVLAEPRRLRAIVAYDGTDWSGWQRQHEHVSVAEMVEAALAAATGEEVAVHAAGRTDAGVHAEGQAIGFATRAALPADGLRSLCCMVLPPSIRVALVEDAPEGWNPQRDAVRKLYRYDLLETARPRPAAERTAWALGAPLDLDRLRAGAALFAGRHDFRAFRNDPGPERRDEDTVREITRLDARRALGVVRLEFEGPGFLYMMVRNLVAALVELGAGRRDAGWVGDLLASRDRRRGPPPAPARGLTLARVWYADGFGDALFASS